VRVLQVDPSAFTPPYDHALCTALARMGEHVTLATSRFGYGDVPPALGYVRDEGAFYRFQPGAPGGRARLAAKLAQHPVDMLRLRRRARAFEIVHFQWLAVQHVDRRLLPSGRPVVLTAHDVLPREPRRGQIDAQRRLYERVDAIVVHSRHGAGRLIDDAGVDPDKVEVIPHGAFHHLAALEPAPLPLPDTQVPVVLFFGLLRPYKGLDVLLDAWRKLGGDRDVHLILVGSGEDAAEVAHRANSARGVHVIDEWVQDRARMRAILSAADLYVFPSRHEGVPVAPLEAMACGLPVVGADASGVRDVVGDAGLVVARDDADALARALGELLDDDDRRADLGRRARKRVEERFALEPVGRALRSFLVDRNES